MAILSVDGPRLLARIEQLAAISPTRLAFSEEDASGRKLMRHLMHSAGLDVRIDPAGNMIGRLPGHLDGPAILFGSHIDTVRDGGKYDGVLGSFAGLECIETLRKVNHITKHPLELVIFANEEGQEFAPLCGSRSMTGSLPAELLHTTDRCGRTLAEAVDYAGGHSSDIQNAMRMPGEIHSFLELHIEQGPILEHLGVSIGVVEGVSGIMHVAVHITGMAAHAGTTPMGLRRDALVAASHFAIATHKTARETNLCRVATVGELRASPNSANIIPGKVDLVLELRDLDAQKIAHAYEHLRREAVEIEGATGATFSFEHRAMIAPVLMDASVQESIVMSCLQLGVRCHHMPSGAGHDAQIMARIAPAGMVFVPSANGISHSKHEFTSPYDCILGANVLLQTILHRDQQLQAHSACNQDANKGDEHIT